MALCSPYAATFSKRVPHTCEAIGPEMNGRDLHNTLCALQRMATIRSLTLIIVGAIVPVMSVED